MKEMNYKYHVNVYADNEEITLKSNDVVSALDFLLKTIASGTKCDLIDGFTGEVLAIANNPDHADYATPEITLMMAGMVYNVQCDCEDCGEETAEPVCGECGGPVNANGVCQHCGVEDDTLRAEPDDLFEFLEQMVAEGKAVKLGGLLS